MISRTRDRHRYISEFYSRRKLRKYIRNIRRFAPLKEHNAANVLIPAQITILKPGFRHLLMKAVGKLHSAALRKQPIIIDFTNTVKIFPHAMLYLFSELNNLINLYPLLKVRCIPARNTKVNHVLDQIGLFKLCYYKFISNIEYDDVIHWRSISGIKVIGPAFDLLIDPHEELPVLPYGLDIYGACIEATKNAFIHAYIGKRELSPVAFNKCAWWMFSQLRDNILTIAICDLGVGIPATLPKTNPSLVARIGKLFSGTLDAHLIKEAINEPSSRTGKSYRGNGLKKIADIARNNLGATLAIHSGRGYVEIARGKLWTSHYKQPFPGTLVVWKLPMEK